MSTILKWAGNKTAIMPELKKHLPAGQRLVEPFAGSCAVMMATDYPHYLVADVNPDLINLYLVIRTLPNSFVADARAMFDSHNSEDSYYKLRDEFNAEPGPYRGALLFLYLNRHGYRGLCRYNKKGIFNVPYGNYKKPYFPENEIRAFAEKAKRATFLCASYEETLDVSQDGDVIYCDPPYDGTFTDYHTDGFNEADQRQLVSILSQKAKDGYAVVASNSYTQLTRDLYFNFGNFACYTVAAKRSMGVAAGDAKSATELIAVLRPSVAYLDELPWFGFDPAAPVERKAGDGVQA
ncbi:TPA: Dam family site-specific DNA-(adenine-N6)-methyltransferase [Kluyvera ascorbata]|nr:Dam family site-specific DNA-(adenine-N6)-methyltransferase [Kluyvera ascorbata]